MKKLLATIAAVIAAGLIYPTTMQVTDVSNDLVTMETSTGFIYQINADDYENGDLVSCIMFSNGTTDITDDIILAARYSGFHID